MDKAPVAPTHGASWHGVIRAFTCRVISVRPVVG